MQCHTVRAQYRGTTSARSAERERRWCTARTERERCERRKDLRELRKNFSEASDLFTMNHVVTAFVDAEKNIRCQNSRAYHDIPEEETDCLCRLKNGEQGAKEELVLRFAV